jgi:NarL family two-component system response regulator LiaR
VRKKIRIIIADGFELFREGLRKLLGDEASFECVGIASTNEKLLELVSELIPDIVLLDITMTDDSPDKLVSRVKAINPDTKVIILTHSENDVHIASCLRLGVGGYLLKDITQRQLINAIIMVDSGEQVLCPIASRSVSRLLRDGIDSSVEEVCPLTDRELQVVKLAATGLTNRQIADKLHVAEPTIASHFINIYRKMAVASRTEAVASCLQHRWLIFRRES